MPQAGLIANELLKKRLAKAGYYDCQFTPGLWRHVWRPITFALVVDDFGVKFTGDVHANHLISTLKKDYEVTVDWKGELFVGIKLEWDYDKRTLDTHVPGFTKRALHKYQHPTPKRPQHAPAKAAPIQYGAKVQTTQRDTSPYISAELGGHKMCKSKGGCDWRWSALGWSGVPRTNVVLQYVIGTTSTNLKSKAFYN